MRFLDLNAPARNPAPLASDATAVKMVWPGRVVVASDGTVFELPSVTLINAVGDIDRAIRAASVRSMVPTTLDLDTPVSALVGALIARGESDTAAQAANFASIEDVCGFDVWHWTQIDAIKAALRDLATT